VLPSLFVNSESLVIFEARIVGSNFPLVEVPAYFACKLVHHSLNLKVTVKSELRTNFLSSVSRSHHPGLMLRLRMWLVVYKGMLIASVKESLVVCSWTSKMHDTLSFSTVVVFFNSFKILVIGVRREERVFGLLQKSTNRNFTSLRNLVTRPL
jgi:hypothetical protein